MTTSIKIENFEYMLYSTKHPVSYELNEFGRDGWELVHIDREGYNWLLFFKRVLK